MVEGCWRFSVSGGDCSIGSLALGLVLSAHTDIPVVDASSSDLECLYHLSAIVFLSPHISFHSR